jgi:hypothetical protein
MSNEEKPQVPEEPQQTAPEESQEEVCEEQQSFTPDVAPEEVEQQPEGIGIEPRKKLQWRFIVFSE